MNNVIADDFLKYLRDLLIQNPGYSLSTENIYDELINIGVGEERNIYIEHLFNNWINNFRNLDNIQVFVDENWDYFCQFVNKRNEVLNYNNHLKLYVPLDSNHIERGAEILFEFLRINNIPHLSKIGKKIRFDDIVIRLINKEDLEKVIEFINNNKYIQEGLMTANPFAFTKNRLAMVSDGDLSYNFIISNYIKLYLDNKLYSNSLHNVSYEDFISFIIEYYNYNLININSKKIFEDFNHEFYNEQYDEKIVLNIKNVTDLILSTNNKKFSFDDYIEYFNNTLEPNLMINYKVDKNMKNVNSVEIENMMSYIIQIMVERFRHFNVAKTYIINYFENANSVNLTRNYDLRQTVVTSGYRQKLLEFLKNTNISIDDYVEYVYKKNILTITQNDNNSFKR